MPIGRFQLLILVQLVSFIFHYPSKKITLTNEYVRVSCIDILAVRVKDGKWTCRLVNYDVNYLADGSGVESSALSSMGVIWVN